MLVSYEWLKEFVDCPLSPAELAEKLTLQGLEVTGLKVVGAMHAGLVVGEVTDCRQHPGADRLKVVLIKHYDAGQEKVTEVVCGASNIAKGQKIILATVGTRLPEVGLIKKAKIRGIVSVGMVCSEKELGLSEEHEGIWVLPPTAGLKEPVEKYLGPPETVLELDLTSNRPDCLSVYGVAQEVAALLKTVRRLPPTSPSLELSPKPSLRAAGLEVLVEASEESSLYTAQQFSRVKVAPSPLWLRKRLHAHGVRPINNVVDVTNYSLLAFGQPLHAFDAEKLSGKKLITRKAKKDEPLLLLSGEEICLTSEDLVIADGERAVALAGVMGGAESGVSEATTEVVLEGASFKAASISAMRQRHQIDTEAARRFERFTDPYFIATVMQQASALMLRLAGGMLKGPLLQSGPLAAKAFAPKKIILRMEAVTAKLGVSLDAGETAALLSRLHLKVEKQSQAQLTVATSSARPDLNHEWELIEEVARLYGYEKFPQQLPHLANTNWQLTGQSFEECRELCLGFGYHETLTYPFVENQFVTKVASEQKEQYVAPLNPISKEYSFLRRDFRYGLLRAMKHNTEKKNSAFNRAFEIGRVFRSCPLPNRLLEENWLGLIGTGLKETLNWSCEEAAPYNFYSLSGEVEELLERFFKQVAFNKKHLLLERSRLEEDFFSPRGAARLILKERKGKEFENHQVGKMGLVGEAALRFFNLREKEVYYAELNLDKLEEIAKRLKEKVCLRYQSTSPFPATERDLAIVIDPVIDLTAFLEDLRRANSLIEEATLLNIYRGTAIEKGKRSAVFRLVFRSKKATLVGEQVDREVEQLVKKLAKKYDFALR